MTRLIITLLWLLSLLFVVPVAAQQPAEFPAPAEGKAPLTGSADRGKEMEVGLGEALRSAVAGTDIHKGRPLLVWLRQRAERQLKVQVR